MQFMRNVSDGGVRIENGQVMAEAEEFFAAHKRQAEVAEGIDTVDWVKDFEAGKQGESETTDNYNSQFWNRLQNEWKKISEEDDLGHPWLSELNDYYEPYKVRLVSLSLAIVIDIFFFITRNMFLMKKIQ